MVCHRHGFRTLVFIGLLALPIALIACGGVRGRRGTPMKSGFLGDYSQLKHREGYDAQLLYLNPNAQWSRYDAVQIDSVTLWATRETAKLTAQEKQLLTAYLYSALHEEISLDFQIVDHPGPSAHPFTDLLRRVPVHVTKCEQELVPRFQLREDRP